MVEFHKARNIAEQFFSGDNYLIGSIKFGMGTTMNDMKQFEAAI